MIDFGTYGWLVTTKLWLSSESLSSALSWCKAVSWSGILQNSIMQRNAGTGDDLRLVQKHQAETKHWVAEGTPWIYKLLKLKTAFLMDFCVEYPYGYSTRNDRIKLKVGTGNTGSFFCGGWMHWEIPAALYRARKYLPALYLWFRRTPSYVPFLHPTHPRSTWKVGQAASKVEARKPFFTFGHEP